MKIHQRLIIIPGKGGAGKTTFSAALAMAASRAGRRTLLVELAGSDALEGLLSSPPLHRHPMQIRPRMWAARTDPRAELEAYVKHHIGIGFIADKITGAKLFDQLVDATPGLREVMTLGSIWRWEKEKDHAGRPRFDLIIVDAPATGHGLNLLRQPGALADMLRAGPVAAHAGQVRDLLTDENRTGIGFVTLAEELPVNEVLESVKDANHGLGMNVLFVAVNKVYPARFSQEEIEHIKTVLETDLTETGQKQTRETRQTRCLLEAAVTQMSLRQVQEAHIEKLSNTEKDRVRTLSIPYFYTNRLSVEDIKEIAGQIIKQIEFADDA